MFFLNVHSELNINLKKLFKDALINPHSVSVLLHNIINFKFKYPFTFINLKVV